jgi:hypothetical protein
VLSPLLADAAAASHEYSSKFFITSKIQSTITNPRTSATMTFSTSNFTRNRVLPRYINIATIRYNWLHHKKAKIKENNVNNGESMKQ